MPQRNPGDSGDNNAAGSRGVFTATGLGGAFLFVLFIILLRGGKTLLIDGLGGNQERNQVAPAQDNRFGDANTRDALAQWMQKESNLKEILACQKQHGLTDDELDRRPAILEAVWPGPKKISGTRRVHLSGGRWVARVRQVPPRGDA